MHAAVFHAIMRSARRDWGDCAAPHEELMRGCCAGHMCSVRACCKDWPWPMLS